MLLLPATAAKIVISIAIRSRWLGVIPVCLALTSGGCTRNANAPQVPLTPQQRESLGAAVILAQDLKSLHGSAVNDTHEEYSAYLAKIQPELERLLAQIPASHPAHGHLTNALHASLEADNYWKHTLANKDALDKHYVWIFPELEAPANDCYAKWTEEAQSKDPGLKQIAALVPKPQIGKLPLVGILARHAILLYADSEVDQAASAARDDSR